MHGQQEGLVVFHDDGDPRIRGRFAGEVIRACRILQLGQPPVGIRIGDIFLERRPWTGLFFRPHRSVSKYRIPPLGRRQWEIAFGIRILLQIFIRSPMVLDSRCPA